MTSRLVFHLVYLHFFQPSLWQQLTSGGSYPLVATFLWRQLLSGGSSPLVCMQLSSGGKGTLPHPLWWQTTSGSSFLLVAPPLPFVAAPI